MELIDKDALVAEIDRQKIGYNVDGKHSVEYDITRKILNIIDTLEVKEVDLDKELSYEDYISFFAEHPNFSDDWGFDEAWVFAKYFFELGLKAQKGEKVC